MSSSSTGVSFIHSYGHECCISCGALNRFWTSRKGYGQDYINWIETGLCPKCFNPKTYENVYVIKQCCLCMVITDLTWFYVKNTESSVDMSHGYCPDCQVVLNKQLGF